MTHRPSDDARLHGGALDAAIARHGGERVDWLDLSTGINPMPPPIPQLSDGVWSRLPERGDEARLIAAARRAYGAPDHAGIVAAPGSQALISMLPTLFDPARVAVVGPTYAEHADAFRAAGHRVAEIESPEALPKDAAIVVLVNPNNPDGRVFERPELAELADKMARRGGLLVVDEAFVDATPERSLSGLAGREGLLIHRSFGKFFGLVGLRLGFALTTPQLALRLAKRFGPWAVSGPALAIGAAMLEDDALIGAIRVDLGRQSQRRDGVLAECGLESVGKTMLFATIEHPGAGAMHEALCRQNILTRPFIYAPNWLRFGNPGSDGDAERLKRALRESLAAIAREQTDVTA